jgi:protein-arginine deiminase
MLTIRNTPWWRATLVAAALASGCGGDPMTMTPTPPRADAGPDRPVEPPLPAVRLVVDADRNGALDDTRAEWMQRAAWSTTAGAMLLANVDDDDSDRRVDATDEVVNGEADEADLARFRVAAWAQAPEGAEGAIALGEAAATRVRIFKRGAEGWAVFDPATARLTREELQQGVEFGIEAKDFPGPQWDGHAELTLTVTGTPMELTDRAIMRTAPWMIYNSIDPTVRVYGPQADGYGPAMSFYYDLDDATTADGMPITFVNTLDRNYRTDPMEGPDVWMQDIMEFGWTGIPSTDGMHAMPVVLRTPNRQRAVARYTERELLGPDFGYVWKYATVAANGRRWDPSLDSFGNTELLPPHRHGDQNFPLGRIIHGSVDTRQSDVALRQFFDAQGVQGPPMYVDTSWLHVGHIDEVISFIPADNALGWKLLIASPRLARTVLQGFMDRDPANGAVTMFAGKNWYYESGPMQGRAYPAQRTVRAILGDATLMAFNQQTQTRIDMIREQIMEATGVTDDDIVEIPFLLWVQGPQRAAAYMPGTVNLLLYNRTAIVARPYGPTVGASDLIEDDMTERLGRFGINVRFAEQWDLLHAAQGEVHCGTNAVREFPQRRWWEVPR